MNFMADLARHIQDVKIYVDFVKLEATGRDKENKWNHDY
jgi:hypothetical protein